VRRGAGPRRRRAAAPFGLGRGAPPEGRDADRAGPRRRGGRGAGLLPGRRGRAPRGDLPGAGGDPRPAAAVGGGQRGVRRGAAARAQGAGAGGAGVGVPADGRAEAGGARLRRLPSPARTSWPLPPDGLGRVIVALASGQVEALAPAGDHLVVAQELSPETGLPPAASALEVLEGDRGQLEALVTSQGSDLVFAFAGLSAPPAPPAVPVPPPP